MKSGKYSNGILIEGNLHQIENPEYINLQLDMSQCSIEGLTLSEFIDYMKCDNPKIEQEYKQALVDYKLDFITEANNSLKRKRLKFQLCNNCGSEILMTIKIIETTRKGNEILYDYIFSDINTGDTIAVIRVYTKEGRIGDFLNLMGDVTREAGNQFGGIYKRLSK